MSRTKWCNHTANECCRPTEIVEPSREKLAEVVLEAAKSGTTLRAVGAGHAWSDVAMTDGVLVKPTNLGGDLLPIDDGGHAPPAGPLVRVPAGTHLHELNEALRDQGLALANMGGYDAQTVAGVVSTSTHGSGITFGPFPDMVRSLDIVTASGKIVRVEPTAGLTDSQAFQQSYGDSRELIQQDAVFDAVICAMGCMGVIDSLVLGVREKFWLNEIRTLDTWEAVKGKLTQDDVLKENEHYELFLNPYPRKNGEHSLVITTREDCDEPADLLPDRRERHPLMEFQSAFPLTWVVVRLTARFCPSLIARRFEWLLRKMCDPGYADISYKVFNIGQANKIPAYSSELAVSLDGGAHIKAVDEILKIARELRERRRHPLIHTSPIALRFVAPSRAYASMMYGRPTMMIELIMAKGTRRGFELLAAYEERLAEFHVRPHWGQYNKLSEATDLRAMYPEWDSWLTVYGQFNDAGVFNSRFTDRIGISRPRTPVN